MNAIEDNVMTKTWSDLGKKYNPKSILMISAHWETDETYVQSAERPLKINDMGGFPEALYELEYPVKGDLDLSKEVRDLLGIEFDDTWGIDHGTWSILTHMYPKADVPVVQLSLNSRLSAKDYYDIGETLKPLRDNGVMIMGSGNVVHSFRGMDPSSKEPTEWALAFDEAIREAILKREIDRLMNYLDLEGAVRAVPTKEHLNPLFYILGASDETDQVTVLNQYYPFSSFSMTSYVFG
jgi:4,5-DOPA dioxygenase extradiol